MMMMLVNVERQTETNYILRHQLHRDSEMVHTILLSISSSNIDRF